MCVQKNLGDFKRNVAYIENSLLHPVTKPPLLIIAQLESVVFLSCFPHLQLPRRSEYWFIQSCFSSCSSFLGLRKVFDQFSGLKNREICSFFRTDFCAYIYSRSRPFPICQLMSIHEGLCHRAINNLEDYEKSDGPLFGSQLKGK